MTARELFYSAAKAPPSAKIAEAPPSAKIAEAPPAKPPKTRPNVVAHRAKPDIPAQSPPSSVPNSPLPGGTKYITVDSGLPTSAEPPATGTPLGLKYTLLKLTGGQMEGVPTNTVFHSEDRIQFDVETNGRGYLYIISQGSSGAWMPMFPSSEDGGSNQVEAFHSYRMPENTRFYFDQQAGTEKLFLILTREKEADLETLVYSLQGGKGKPVAAPGAEPPLIRASIDDRAVDHLRTTYARDLIIEAVGVNTPGEKKENAVYVVNPTGSRDSRLVVDLLLEHK